MLSIIITTIPILFLFCSYMIGRSIEKSHIESIKLREKKFQSQPVISGKKSILEKNIEDSRLAYGSVVISIDYFKRFLAVLVYIFGGEVVSYSSLLERARKEAILRMKQSAPNADLYYNLRMETSSISKGEDRAIGSIEIFCYATAISLNK